MLPIPFFYLAVSASSETIVQFLSFDSAVNATVLYSGVAMSVQQHHPHIFCEQPLQLLSQCAGKNAIVYLINSLYRLFSFSHYIPHYIQSSFKFVKPLFLGKRLDNATLWNEGPFHKPTINADCRTIYSILIGFTNIHQHIFITPLCNKHKCYIFSIFHCFIFYILLQIYNI